MSVDVLIVGAGPVGLVLANLLGVGGLNVLLVEANTTTSDVPKAILIDDESFRTFQAIGLADDIRAHVVYGTGARYYSASGRALAAVRPAVGAYGYAKRSAFGQPDLERILLDGLTRYPNVEVRFDTRLTALTPQDDGELAALPTGNVRARWVVGCDGGRSTVRELSGIAMQGQSFEERWLILDTLNDPDDARYTKFFCNPARPAVSVPAPGGGRRYEFMLLPGEAPESLLTDASIATLMQGRRRLDDADIVRKTVYTFHALAAQHFRAGRRLLAGDAAHMMPPFAGQGMNTGIRDAANLAWKLVAEARGLAGADLLDSYEVERRAHVEAMIALSVRLGRIVMPTSAAKARVRDAIFTALGLIPPVRDYIATMRWKPAPRCAAGAFVEPGRGLIGAMLPQPDVLTGDNAAVRLDEVMGSGFALLATDAAVLDRLTDPLWTRLDARRVAVIGGDRTPRGRAVGDVHGGLGEAFAAHQDEVLLVRPDRYLAGAFRPADEARFAAAFAATLGAPDMPITLRQAA